jgi:hypothetical protein
LPEGQLGEGAPIFVIEISLREKIEKAFAHRQMPTEVVEPEEFLQFDSDVEEALWFAGRDWHEITCEDWRSHNCAVTFLSPEALAYYLPSLLTLTVENPKEYPDLAVDSLINELDRTPCVDGWDDHFRSRFLGLRPEEYDVMKAWLLFMCENFTNYSCGAAASGPGETFGRAFDTIDLLQEETRNPAKSQVNMFL